MKIMKELRNWGNTNHVKRHEKFQVAIIGYLENTIVYNTETGLMKTELHGHPTNKTERYLLRRHIQFLYNINLHG